ncbi:MAG: transporter substrate-binding domain-containing protein [Tenericutes bacterium]|nr:transporter substrate-binding domain-containing protein [Mycoplasmatota bacterium]
MKKWKKVIILLLIVLGIPILMKLDIRMRYDIDFLEYIKYNSELTNQEISLIGERPLNVGVYDDPPLSFTNEFNNYNAGIVVDYISQLAIETRSNMNLKVRQNASILDSLNSNDVDIIVMENSIENSEIANLSLPLAVVKTKILVPSDSQINNVQDFEGKKIVALKDDNIDGRISAYFRDRVNVELIEVDNIYQCFAIIRNKGVAGFVGDDMEAVHFLNVTNRSNSYRFLDMVLYEKEISLATQKNNDQLISIINKGIIEMKRKNLIVQTQYKWLGDFDTDSLDLRTIETTYNIILGVLAIVTALASWNYVITQRVNTKTRELSESKEELRLIIDTMKNGLMVIDDSSMIIECNDFLERLIEVPRKSLLGKQYSEIASLEPFVKEDNMNKLTSVGDKYYYISKQRVSNNKCMIMIEDYTENYLREKSARQESKMVAVGQLSAGLAHEIRNPLGLIKSYNFIIEKHKISDLCDHAVRVIDNSVDRINKLVENLLRFSRLSNDEIKHVELSKLFEDIIESKEERILNNDIVVKVSFQRTSKQAVTINEEVLRMVVHNLIDNGIDSFRGVVRDKKEITLVLEVRDNMLHLEVSDNGCGIGEDKIDKIFDPFYSTKESGTGLGLYIISTEIMNNNGSISVFSSVGEGTTFNVELPIMG